VVPSVTGIDIFVQYFQVISVNDNVFRHQVTYSSNLRVGGIILSFFTPFSVIRKFVYIVGKLQPSILVTIISYHTLLYLCSGITC